MDYLKKIGVNAMNEPSQFVHPYYYVKYIKTFYYILPLIIGDWYLRRNERVLKLNSNYIIRFILYLFM